MDKSVGVSLTFKGDGSPPWLVRYDENMNALEVALDETPPELYQKIMEGNLHYAATYKLTNGLAAKPVEAPTNGSPVVPSQPVHQAERTPTAWTPASSANPVTGQVPVQQQASAGAPVNGQQHPAGAACGNCGAVKTYASGIGRESQKPWKKWGCPNARRDNPCDAYTEWIR